MRQAASSSDASVRMNIVWPPLCFIPAAVRAGGHRCSDVSSWACALRERRPVHRTAHVAVAQIAARRAILLVFVLHPREAVAVRADVGALGRVDAVELGVVAAEHGSLNRAIGGAERLEAVLLLHVLGNFKTAQCLDLPLRR